MHENSGYDSMNDWSRLTGAVQTHMLGPGMQGMGQADDFEGVNIPRAPIIQEVSRQYRA